MSFLTFLLTGALVYFAWRIVDQMPDVVFRLGEIQRDIAELRRAQERDQEPALKAPVPAQTPAPIPPPVPSSSSGGNNTLP